MSIRLATSSMRSGKELPDSERSNHSTRQIGHSASEAFSVRFARPNFTSVLDVFGVTGLVSCLANIYRHGGAFTGRVQAKKPRNLVEMCAFSAAPVHKLFKRHDTSDRAGSVCGPSNGNLHSFDRRGLSPEADDANSAKRGAINGIHIQARHEARGGPEIQLTWPEDGTSPPTKFDPTAARADILFDKTQELNPRHDVQRSPKARLLMMAISLGQTRWLLFEQNGSSIPVPFLGYWFSGSASSSRASVSLRLPTRPLSSPCSSARYRFQARSS